MYCENSVVRELPTSPASLFREKTVRRRRRWRGFESGLAKLLPLLLFHRAGGGVSEVEDHVAAAQTCRRPPKVLMCQCRLQPDCTFGASFSDDSRQELGQHLELDSCEPGDPASPLLSHPPLSLRWTSFSGARRPTPSSSSSPVPTLKSFFLSGDTLHFEVAKIGKNLNCYS